MKHLAVCMLPFFALAVSAYGQVMIAPTLIYMDSQEPFGTFTVINQSDKPQEVSLDFEFGYPASDSRGNRFFQFEDSLSAASYGLTDWIKCFPKRFVLAPSARQTVRMMVRSPATLADGVYWTRLATTAMDRTAPVDPSQVQFAAHVKFAVRQIIPVLFRNGNATTSVLMKRMKVDVGDRDVAILADLERQGNAPFLGTVTLKIFDATGKLVEEVRKESDVYLTYTERLAVERSKLAPGRYTAEVTLASELSGIPSHKLPSMKPVRGEVAFEIPQN